MQQPRHKMQGADHRMEGVAGFWVNRSGWRGSSMGYWTDRARRSEKLKISNVSAMLEQWGWAWFNLPGAGHSCQFLDEIYKLLYFVIDISQVLLVRLYTNVISRYFRVGSCLICLILKADFTGILPAVCVEANTWAVQLQSGQKSTCSFGTLFLQAAASLPAVFSSWAPIMCRGMIWADTMTSQAWVWNNHNLVPDSWDEPWGIDIREQSCKSFPFVVS